VQRRAHQRAAHHTPLGDQLCQLVEAEAVSLRLQADKERVEHLSLHADQALNRLVGGQLPEGTVEGAPG